MFILYMNGNTFNDNMHNNGIKHYMNLYLK